MAQGLFKMVRESAICFTRWETKLFIPAFAQPMREFFGEV
jgi:hypothetical protein